MVRINAWSTVLSYEPYADRPSYAQLHEHHGLAGQPCADHHAGLRHTGVERGQCPGG